MAYIGNNPDSVLQGRKATYTFTATAGQTVFSGIDDNGNTLDLLQAESNDVYLNGSRLIDVSDFTVSGDVLTLTSAAAVNDIMVISTQQEFSHSGTYTKAETDSRYINYDGDIVNGSIQMGGGPGNNITFADNNKIVMGTGNDLEIYHSGTNSYIDDVGEGSLFLRSGTTYIQNAAGTKTSILTNAGAGQTLYYNNTPKIATTNVGMDVTGTVTSDGLTVDGQVIVDGGTGVDSSGVLHVRQNGNGSGNGIAITSSNPTSHRIWKDANGKLNIGPASSSSAFVQDLNGNIGIGTNDPGRKLTIAGGNNAKISFTGGGTQSLYFGDGTGAAEYAGYIHYAHADDNMRFNTTGDFTFRGGNVTVEGTTKAEQYLLDAVAKDISFTASDVFIYDTRKDSDGGAWRKRTQHTSWYNETLNTATRGSRKEFPAVAVLAFNTSQELYIYDGDDPDLPLWAKYTNFTQDSGDTAAITAVNGSIYAGQAHAEQLYSGNGYFQLNFAADYFFSNIVGTFGTYLQGRADGLLTSYDYKIRGDRTTSKYSMPNLKVNDIAVTVLPNAPIDSDTGLPTPTIALATYGGVGIIKDNGTVVDWYRYDGNEYSRSVAFDENNSLFVTWGTTLGQERHLSYHDTIPSSDDNQMTDNYYNSYSGVGSTAFGHNGQGIISNNARAFAATIDRQRLFLLDHNRNNTDNSSVCDITSDYNTGWMNGDIKLATLSDTDDTNVTGAELVTNGTFDSNVTGWTANGGSSLSHQSGQAKVTASSSNIMLTQQLSGLVVGQKYTLSATITPFAGISGKYWGVYLNNSFSNLVKELSASDQVATNVSATFTATATNNYISIAGSSGAIVSGEYLLVDNVSVRLAEEDRSVNGNGLQVFGTITKTPVATGAELVSYGNFANTRYLFQPYDAGLSPGNADVCFMHWHKGDTNKIMIWTSLRRPVAQGDAGGWIQFWTGTSSGTQLQFGVRNGDGSRDNRVGVNSTAFHDGQWHHYVGLRRGGVYEIYVDGKLQGSTNHGSNSTLTTDTHKFLVGNHFDFNGAYSVSGDMALVKYSLTAPSPEQIAKIYNDEKFLFQENAKATLYGTSDAVTALAYDDDTELLHAGTSAGRSVFQGLRRIDNTTVAVGAAISASNGMVAED